MAGEKIINFLEEKKAQSFTGCVKMAFEDGKLSFILEANHLDLPMTKIFSQKAVLELVAVTAERGFADSLCFSSITGRLSFIHSCGITGGTRLRLS